MMGLKDSRAIMRNAKMPFVDEGHCITKAQQSFLSIHGSIPCNLAPAHFTVHIAYAIKLRSRVCRGGESCMRSFFACCVFMYLYGLRFPAARETLIKSLLDFTLEILCIARNNLTRIASYLRKDMTKLCIKILVKADSAI